VKTDLFQQKRRKVHPASSRSSGECSATTMAFCRYTSLPFLQSQSPRTGALGSAPSRMSKRPHDCCFQNYYLSYQSYTCDGPEKPNTDLMKIKNAVLALKNPALHARSSFRRVSTAISSTAKGASRRLTRRPEEAATMRIVAAPSASVMAKAASLAPITLTGCGIVGRGRPDEGAALPLSTVRYFLKVVAYSNPDKRCGPGNSHKCRRPTR
jgi:hypothetical protein